MKRVVLFVLACGAGTGVQAVDLEGKLRTCSAIESERDRLGCYDALARGLLNDPDIPLPATPSPTLTTQPAAPPPASTADFGIEHRTSSHPSGETLSATLALAERGGYGQWRITLDNGQVWEQVGTDRYQLAAGDQVVIERGRFNSFFLRKQSSDRKVRFTRLN